MDTCLLNVEVSTKAKAPLVAGLSSYIIFLRRYYRLVGGADGTRTRDLLRDRQAF